ncbi:MAG TPA: hypothetical protein VLD16_01785 [Gaiellaceae bacterium]|nr:hypothetical protein [Gaiellaceae bacterium]
MHEHDDTFDRDNMTLGLALFGLFLVLFGLTVVVALIYLAVF